jgi:ornithine cyclodeaminase
MGADQKGKRELPVDLLQKSRLFADYVRQSIDIGEFQYIREAIVDGTILATNIGDVVLGRCPGRESPTDITVYDSSGLALQDLYVAFEVARIAKARNIAIQVQEMDVATLEVGRTWE